jgi:hypothetical protein
VWDVLESRSEHEANTAELRASVDDLEAEGADTRHRLEAHEAGPQKGLNPPNALLRYAGLRAKCRPAFNIQPWLIG